jgi:hypothetical protein
LIEWDRGSIFWQTMRALEVFCGAQWRKTFSGLFQDFFDITFIYIARVYLRQKHVVVERPLVAVPSFSAIPSMAMVVIGCLHRCFFIGWLLLFLYDAHSFILSRTNPTTQQCRSLRPTLYAANATPTASLGDIMSETISLPPSKSLQETYPYFQNPLDRMILTANGNVQRLISSYYDSPVQLRIVYCTLRERHAAKSDDLQNAVNGMDQTIIWDRQVELSMYQDHVFCRATSEILVHDPACRLTELGIAQFFRHSNILPHFSLQAAGALDEGGGFWRRYTLSCPQLTCHIREEFPAGLWNIVPPSE